jgi:hypothetical protein
MTRFETAMARGQFDAAFDQATLSMTYGMQSTSASIEGAFAAAAATRNPEHLREVVRLCGEVPSTGRLSTLLRTSAEAALAAVEGNSTDAVARFRTAITELDALEEHFAAAQLATVGIELLPDHPEMQILARNARPLIDQLGARPWLERLDAALGAGTAGAPSPGQAAAAPVPARPPG